MTSPHVPASRRRWRAAPLLLAGLLAGAPAPVFATGFELDFDTWARPRSASAVMRMVPVRAAVQAWMAAPDQQLEIRYPGGESGMLWAEELRDWLVSLGIPLNRIQTLSGSAVADRLLINLRPPENSP